MKKLKSVFAIGLLFGLMTACTSSATDDFEAANELAKRKTLKMITAINQANSKESASSSFTYDVNNKLVNVSATEGSEATSVSYLNDGSVIKAGDGNGNSENFAIQNLYKAPYNVYETGDVLEYDANKNPSKIAFRDMVYNYETGEYIMETQTAELTYDTNPNLYFGTLESAGLIEILDGVSLDFGINTQASEVLKARALLPTNNVTKIVYKDADQNIVGTLNIEYTYDADGYPVKGTGVATSNNKNENNEPIRVDVVYSYN
ncbi:hypothetical protein LNI90_01820 [Tenacibaculum dicentrarchi]|nr:hypothetical protein [Tenacibaculum dicentrarchi]MCD8419010.1 hypothetical protein [Tenacibaculum dicentrarchi]MCD8436656.1 hypothetical protein [Tenacibaculum dicentrarchi]MCD8450817.1 hypothetical protein [Tenacibaculum dicentrarchi]MCG8826916.1 hypothetical protein [Tenacibaculum dicentrarchi]